MSGNADKKSIFILFLSVVIFWCSPAVYDCSAETENQYFENGNISVSRVLNAMGDVVQEKYHRNDGSLEQGIKYDDDHHKIAEAYYDNNGRLRTGADGWAAMKWKYDGGNMVGEGYYGSNGRLTEYKKYNSEGDLVYKKYVGSGNIDPAEEYNPVPPLAGETISYYDSGGRPEGSTSIGRGGLLFPEEWEE